MSLLLRLRPSLPLSIACRRLRPLAFLLLLPFAALHYLFCPHRNEAAVDVSIGIITTPRPGLLVNYAGSDVITLRRGSHAVLQESLRCDRSHFRTDVCVVRGDVRVIGGVGRRHPTVLQVVGPQATGDNSTVLRNERIRPYTRKWEESVMKTIDEVTILQSAIPPSMGLSEPPQECDVRHSAPAILFSTGGYTGNVYHEFNDGLIPLYLSAGHLRGDVVLVILEYHKWWMTKYREVIKILSKYDVVDLSSDSRIHCFDELKVGMNIDGDLVIHDRLPPSGAKPSTGINRRLDLLPDSSLSMRDFQENVLRAAYLPKRDGALAKIKAAAEKLRSDTGIARITAENRRRSGGGGAAPRLTIVSRRSPRAIRNQKAVMAMAAEVGFEVSVLSPEARTEMAEIYWQVNECEVVLGVHGAALTHLLFMRRQTELIQVVPLGLDWAAATYYGEPAAGAGLIYTPYRVTPPESSLSKRYAAGDPVISDPESVNRRGWAETKRIYLQSQDLTLNVRALRSLLKAARRRSLARSPEVERWPENNKIYIRETKAAIEFQ